MYEKCARVQLQEVFEKCINLKFYYKIEETSKKCKVHVQRL